MEKKLTIFIAVFFVLTLGYLFVKDSAYNIGLSTEVQAKETVQPSKEVGFDTKSTGSMGSGDALVELTPRMNDRGKLLVYFRANTHSVSLGKFDLSKITTLEYGGKTLRPVKAGRLGGHHAESLIVFDVGKELKNFKITLHGIPAINERVYEWNEG